MTAKGRALTSHKNDSLPATMSELIKNLAPSLSDDPKFMQELAIRMTKFTEIWDEGSETEADEYQEQLHAWISSYFEKSKHSKRNGSHGAKSKSAKGTVASADFE